MLLFLLFYFIIMSDMSESIKQQLKVPKVEAKKRTRKNKAPSSSRNKTHIKASIYDFLIWYNENIANNKLAPLINYNLLSKYYEQETAKSISYTSVKRYIDEYKYVDNKLISKIDNSELLKGGIIKKRDNKQAEEIEDIYNNVSDVVITDKDLYKTIDNLTSNILTDLNKL